MVCTSGSCESVQRGKHGKYKLHFYNMGFLPSKTNLMRMVGVLLHGSGGLQQDRRKP